MATAAREKMRTRLLPPDPASVPEARHFAVEAVTDFGAPGTVGETELLVSELATNAVLHARTPMRVSVFVNDERVRVEVRDSDPRLPSRRDPDPLAPGGRGIMLVEMIARSWGINHNDRGKTVWFELADDSAA